MKRRLKERQACVSFFSRLKGSLRYSSSQPGNNCMHVLNFISVLIVLLLFYHGMQIFFFFKEKRNTHTHTQRERERKNGRKHKGRKETNKKCKSGNSED